MIDSPDYKVLLPKGILDQQNHLTESAFMKLVRQYMKRYPHYIVHYVEEGCAACSRKIEDQKKRKKKR